MGILKFISKVCVQTAVYWSAPSPNGFGEMQFASPVEIKCRWDDTTEIITNKHGAVVNSRATLLVTQQLDENGYLFLGSLEDLSAEQKENPLLVPKSFAIERADKNPLFKSRDKFVHQIYL